MTFNSFYLKPTLLVILLFAFLAFNSCKKTEKQNPKLSFQSEISVEEGTDVQQFAVLSLQLSNDYDQDVTVLYQTSDGTAKAGEDYEAITDGKLVFTPGETSKEVKIALKNDDVYESDETFSLIVTKVTNANLVTSQCLLTILNDDLSVPELVLPNRMRFVESATTVTTKLTIKLSSATTVPVQVKWSTLEGSAKAGTDFVASTNNSLTFNPGEIQKQIQIELIDNAIFEMDKAFFLHFSDIENATFVPNDILVIISDNDIYTPEASPDGPITPDNYPNFELVWSDEFSGTEINTNNWGYDIGAGGWGNNELQTYTNASTNSFVADGKLNIIATKQYNNYRSARLLSKDKKIFTYGRIDFRAKLPIGQGIWPALWMLGNNISQVSWPRCGEIDIMEYLGHEPKTTHGTLHYNNSGHRYQGDSYNLPGAQNFNDNFHIFSLVWSEYGLKWYVDYNLFFELTDDEVAFEAFRLPQFFIMNVAVGGNWPGYPDETTVFPQTMQVDYVRVFKPVE